MTGTTFNDRADSAILEYLAVRGNPAIEAEEQESETSVVYFTDDDRAFRVSEHKQGARAVLLRIVELDDVSELEG